MAAETIRDFRRGQIVAAARALVAEEGIESLTIAALEARLSFSRGVITYHFRDKDEIVQAVFSGVIEEIDATSRHAIESSASPEEKVRAVIAANVHGFVERTEAGRVLLSFWGRISSDARIRAVNAKLYATYRRRTKRLLEAVRAPLGNKDVDLEAMSGVIVGVVIGLATQWIFDPRSIDLEASIDEATRSVIARLKTKRS